MYAYIILENCNVMGCEDGRDDTGSGSFVIATFVFSGVHSCSGFTSAQCYTPKYPI
jgi:hypothetical protein